MMLYRELAKVLGVSKSQISKVVRSEFEVDSLRRVKVRGGMAVDLSEEQVMQVRAWFASNGEVLEGASEVRTESADEVGSEVVRLYAALLAEKDARIADLRAQVERQEDEIARLRAEVDALESAAHMPFWRRLLGSSGR